MLPYLTLFDLLSESEIVYQCIAILNGSVLPSKAWKAEWLLMKQFCYRDREFNGSYNAHNCLLPELHCTSQIHYILVMTLISLQIEICTCIIIKSLIILQLYLRLQYKDINSLQRIVAIYHSNINRRNSLFMHAKQKERKKNIIM